MQQEVAARQDEHLCVQRANSTTPIISSGASARARATHTRMCAPWRAPALRAAESTSVQGTKRVRGSFEVGERGQAVSSRAHACTRASLDRVPTAHHDGALTTLAEGMCMCARAVRKKWPSRTSPARTLLCQCASVCAGSVSVTVCARVRVRYRHRHRYRCVCRCTGACALQLGPS